MPYTLDENDNHFLDDNGNKIEFSVEYIDTDDWYKHKEPLHINDDGHIDCEDRNLIVKEAIQPDHAVCKKQLDQLDTKTKQDTDNKLSALQTLINTSITALFKAHEAKILAQIINFRNTQIQNRIQRKYLTIPKIPNKWIKLFDYKDVGSDVVDLREIIILNTWIKKYYRYHHSKSASLEEAFGNTIQFYYNNDMSAFFTYFTSVPDGWSLECFIEWLRIPQPISIDNESSPKPKPEPKLENNR